MCSRLASSPARGQASKLASSHVVAPDEVQPEGDLLYWLVCTEDALCAVREDDVCRLVEPSELALRGGIWVSSDTERQGERQRDTHDNDAAILGDDEDLVCGVVWCGCAVALPVSACCHLCL